MSSADDSCKRQRIEPSASTPAASPSIAPRSPHRLSTAELPRPASPAVLPARTGGQNGSTSIARHSCKPLHVAPPQPLTAGAAPITLTKAADNEAASSVTADETSVPVLSLGHPGAAALTVLQPAAHQEREADSNLALLFAEDEEDEEEGGEARVEGGEQEGDGGTEQADAEAAAGRPHPRLAHLPIRRIVQDGVISAELCRELIFVFRSTSTVGYRPHLRSATIHDVAATAPWLLPPLVAARRAVLAAVEAAFGLSLELSAEFSGLMGWGAGAQLGWHHDANREYLAQRHLTAVLYLNSQGAEFGAGDFRFRDGPKPLRVPPRAGRLVAYTADARNVHCVEQVVWGERCTLTLWFSLEPAAAEDGRVLQRLCADPCLLPQQLPQPQPPPQPPPRDPHADADASAAAATGARMRLRMLPRPLPLGPGLPDTMYQLPLPAAAEEEGEEEEQPRVGAGGDGSSSSRVGAVRKSGAACSSSSRGGGDVRLERLRRLGLIVMSALDREAEEEEEEERQPEAGEGRAAEEEGVSKSWLLGAHSCADLTSGGGDGSGTPTRRAGVWMGLQHSHEPGTTAATAATTTEEEEVAVGAAGYSSCLQTGRRQQTQPSGRPLHAGGAAGGNGSLGMEAAGAAAVTAVSMVPASALCPQAPGATTLRAARQLAGATSPLAPEKRKGKQAVWFASSLQEALIVAEFMSYKLGVVRITSVRKLDEGMAQMVSYVDARMAEVRAALPTWVTLGSLLG